MTLFKDTIFALSSGRLPAGVAVVRISGPQSRFVYETMIGSLPTARLAKLATISNRGGEPLDRGLALWFDGPASFTGEDSLELHLHGGVAVVTAVLQALGELDDVRHAEPGEFTRRAFAHGKLDLVQAEALGDLVSAETEAQRRFALLNAEGRQGALYRSWRERLVHARAMIEAELDFADEADVPGSVADRIWPDMERLAQEIADHCGHFRRAEMLRDGFDVVIIGAPNAGKSSLLNALVQRDVAIVSNEAGTTRDLIEVALDLEGYKVRITDTAGLRDAEGAVERIGVDRAIARARGAHLVVEVLDMSEMAAPTLDGAPAPQIRVGSKADLGRGDAANFDVVISTVDGRGVDTLLGLIRDAAKAAAGASTDLAPSRLRQVLLLKDGERHIRRSLRMDTASLELRAEELRLAGSALGRITGDVDVEDLLDAIFSNFCIGK
ncbi:tRNA uridine-5-carboxymethylaminomethyl(34) synthesis GTPase MnmE [Arvimicrobium flavum]|uniref:tRNA uridine-5-carboxymethylaminomethyl(34) synthesis GTPase MnmE n=1 Tax=Arvimicrobium flavum TaxID=3393320 RepID=UPI00237B0F91|nr:tRNA uridine-5-carboxymethylaminomethyl(34) synthesis GTPase MnmE [Mesorhizobium shangrilense]